MIYIEQPSVNTRLFLTELSVGAVCSSDGVGFIIEDVLLGKYIVLMRKEKEAYHGQLHEIQCDRSFKCLQTYKVDNHLKEGRTLISVRLVNEALKYILRTELLSDERGYIIKQSKINEI
jgi:hypothetical protein